VIDDIPVYHPRFFSVPGTFKFLDGVFYFLSVMPLVRRLRREFKFELVDAHFVYPDGVAGCMVGRWFRCPVTITLRGTIGKLSKFMLRRKQIQWALGAATRVFSVSCSLQNIAVTLGCDLRKIRVIPNGVDSTVFKPMDKAVARHRLGLPLDRRIIISVGALCERKGHHRIIEVLPSLISAYPNLLLVVVGGPGPEGDMGPELTGLIKQLDLESHVRVVGPRPHVEIATWLAAANIFCLATSNEGMANVIVEALACGIPVVTTRVGGNAELVQDEVNGLLVEVGDSQGLHNALLQALNKEWSQAGVLQTIAGRTWDATATLVLQGWRESLGSKQEEETREHSPINA
jgi:glycosyltransferase involved in cell wall biosynthesis